MVSYKSAEKEMNEEDDAEAPKNKFSMPTKLSRKGEKAHFESFVKDYEKFRKEIPVDIPLAIYESIGLNPV